MLHDKLDDLASDILQNHPNIDFGGCCVFAAHVAKYLVQHVTIRIVIGQDYSSIRNLNRIREKINPLEKTEWEDHDIDFAHVLVEFKQKGKWFAYDATNGVMGKKEHWEESRWRRNKGEITIEEATSLANTPTWNSDFDRDEIPEVRRRIDNFFRSMSRKKKRKWFPWQGS